MNMVGVDFGGGPWAPLNPALTSHCYMLRYVFGTFKIIWPVVPHLGFCPQVWGFQCFLGLFLSDDLGF